MVKQVNGRTINGQSFKEVMEKLAEPFERVVTDYSGKYPAISYDMVENRMDEVLGLNYSFQHSEPELIEQNSKNYVVCKKASIVIYDDEGKFVTTRSQCGGTQLVVLTEGDNAGNPKDMPSDFKRAVEDAFKKCARKFSVGRFITDDKTEVKLVDYQRFKKAAVKNKNSNNQPRQASSINNNSNSNSTNTDPEPFKVISMPSIMAKSTKVKVMDVGDREGSLILWKNVQDGLSADAVKKIQQLRPGDIVKVVYDENYYGNELQFTVKDVAI